jgi:serine/threonine protein kinase
VSIAYLSWDCAFPLTFQIVREIGHPNLVKFFDVFRDGESTWLIVMEKLNGGELFDRIVAKRHYSEMGARTIFLQILDAIRALHKHNIIHRDLKPENLVFETLDEDSLVSSSSPVPFNSPRVI